MVSISGSPGRIVRMPLTAGQHRDASEQPWWRSATIYQVYPRSFADGDGDGIGDLAGLRHRLPHLRDLGVDALWITPWYVSPMADGGYDVADYRDIDPLFGTLAEAEDLIKQAHDLGLRLIVDIVPNHCSDRHPWFQSALAAGPGSAERDLFHFRPGRGEDGATPPNDWQSHFGGPAWTRITEPDGTPGQWYLHLFDVSQPDFNWDRPEIRADFETTLRFWLDRGVDGFRIDVANLLVKKAGLPDVGPVLDPVDDPFRDRPEVHDIYRSWRAVLDSYPGDRVFVGELWVPSPETLALYLRPDELHTGFNFHFLQCPWDGGALRKVIDETLAAHTVIGAPTTWVLSNHDVTRHVTRFGRENTSYADSGVRVHQVPVDLALGRRRARAAVLLVLALPGSAYLYQGEELGLWEVEDIPVELRQDPTWERSGHTDLGRDGCRVPLPWHGTAAPFGFSPAGAATAPWLPQPAAWRDFTVQAQGGDPDSMLSLYREALRLRRTEPSLGDGPLTWLPDQSWPEGLLAFSRGAGLLCVVNLSRTATQLPAGEVILASASLTRGGTLLPPDAAVWLRR
jgi:alpha-glucosidase